MDRHPAGTLYHKAAWQTVVSSIFGHQTYYLYAETAGKVTGVLPLIRLKSLLFGDYLVSMPYVNYGGMLADASETGNALMERAFALGDELGVRHIEFRNTEIVDETLPVRSDKVCMKLSLPETAKALSDSLKAKVRSQYKRPMREGAEASFGRSELLDQFYGVYARNMRDLGTPVYGKRFFTEILAGFSDCSFICVVRIEEQPVAAGFLLGYKDCLEIPWASSIREYNRLGVNMFLYWKVLEHAIEQGYHTFDFGRSSVDSGTYKFKKQWGAVPQQLYWHYWLAEGRPLPNLTPDNPKYRLAIRCWQRLPLLVANRLGPAIVKNLP